LTIQALLKMDRLDLAKSVFSKRENLVIKNHLLWLLLQKRIKTYDRSRWRFSFNTTVNCLGQYWHCMLSWTFIFFDFFLVRIR